MQANNSIPKIESFTFEKQKAKFRFIKAIGEYIDKNISEFVNVWPFLGTYTKKGAWHPDLDEDLEIIGIAHYTVLKSLCYIIRNKDCVDIDDPDQKYKNIIFHYALLVDCIVEIHKHILKFQKKLDPNDDYSVRMLEKSVKKDNNGNYKKEPIKEFYKARFSMFDSFYKFHEIIYPIRNAFIHNPSIDVFFRVSSNGKEEKLVVKPEYIRNNKIIQSISRLKRNALIEPKKFMDKSFNQATEMLSDIWKIIYEQLVIINNHPKFVENYLGKEAK